LKSQLGDAESLNEAIATYSLILEQLSPNEQPGIVLMVARSLGRIRFDRSEWEQSSESYRIAIEGLNALYRNQLMLAGREAWLTKAGDIYRYAAYALAKAGRTEEAIVTMEQGRGRGLRVALARDRTNLTKIRELNPALYDLYESAAARLRQLEARERSSPQKLEQEAPDQVDQDFYHQLRQARRDLETAIEKVRETPGYERFLNEPGFEDIRNAVHSTRPLIYLVPTSAGSLALLCLKDPGRESQDLTIEVVEGDLTEEELDEFILVRWSEIQDDDAAADNLESYKGQFDESLRSLGRDLIGQLAARLRQLGLKSVVLVPCGKFGLMPIHASSYEVAGQTLRLLEEFDVASSPSAQALSVSLATREQRSQADPIFLGVGNPLPAVRPLNFATAEIMHLAALFKTAHPLIEESATTEAVLSKAPAAAYLHFACHGIFNADDPLDSGLELSNDEMLTLRLILSSEREAFGRAYLAVLSACETAVVEVQRTADEVISLPSGLLQMGVPGIVGCLWPVNDVSTYLLMTKFYELLLRSDEQPEPVDYGFSRVRALCRAQLWLKEVTAEELASLFKKEVNKPKTEKAMQDHLAMAAWQRFQIMKPNEQPFSHAIYWAAFTFTGS
jgi:CHAT domain-containing protein